MTKWGHRRRVTGLLALLLVVSLVGLAACSKDDDEADAARPAGLAQALAQPVEPVDAVKVLVDQPGLVYVSADALSRVGFDLSSYDPARLALDMAGESVAFALDDAQGSVAGITFYGQPREGRYSRANVYWLRAVDDLAGGSMIAGHTLAAADGEPQAAFQDRFTLEEAVSYQSQMPPQSDHWLWDPVVAPGVFTVSFDLADWAGGDAQVAVTVWGNTEHVPSDPDHHAVLRVNGEVVADESWDGAGWHTVEAIVPAATLQADANELLLELPGDTEAPAEMAYMDRIDITYPRQMLARDGSLTFAAEAGRSVAVDGFQTDDLLLWDVTDPRTPLSLDGYAVASGANGQQITFQDADSGGQRTYLAVERDRAQPPAALIPDHGRDLRDNPKGADYIAVVHPDLEEALQPLLDFHRSRGLRVTVATIDEVYDTFSHGLLDPAAIRDYMIYARENWPEPAPRFLLLVGDASYDFQGYLDPSTPNLVPTYLISTQYVGETASDNWFVSLDGDGQPDMAVGRIPAQTPEQVAAIVAKTLAYANDRDAASWAGRALFVADNKQEGFQAISDSLADDFLPTGFQVDKVYVGETEDPREAIIDSIHQGVGLVTYVGHGSIKVWTKDKIFQIDDIPQLDNSSALPFMMTMTCLVGYFHHPQVTSMGELMLFEEDGGVVAALVPTSESLANDQRELAENIYRHLFDGKTTVGEAIMLAKQELPKDRNGMQDLIETFVLLGDPALLLHRPAN